MISSKAIARQDGKWGRRDGWGLRARGQGGVDSPPLFQMLFPGALDVSLHLLPGLTPFGIVLVELLKLHVVSNVMLGAGDGTAHNQALLHMSGQGILKAPFGGNVAVANPGLSTGQEDNSNAHVVRRSGYELVLLSM